MNQNGKGSAPRNCFSQKFRDNYDSIFMKPKYKCPPKQAFRLIQDNDGHWYIIKAGEVQIFGRWLDAMEGRRHMPADFSPVRVDRPESVRFCEYWESSE